MSARLVVPLTDAALGALHDYADNELHCGADSDRAAARLTLRLLDEHAALRGRGSPSRDEMMAMLLGQAVRDRDALRERHERALALIAEYEASSGPLLPTSTIVRVERVLRGES